MHSLIINEHSIIVYDCILYCICRVRTLETALFFADRQRHSPKLAVEKRRIPDSQASSKLSCGACLDIKFAFIIPAACWLSLQTRNFTATLFFSLKHLESIFTCKPGTHYQSEEPWNLPAVESCRSTDLFEPSCNPGLQFQKRLRLIHS